MQRETNEAPQIAEIRQLAAESRQRVLGDWEHPADTVSRERREANAARRAVRRDNRPSSPSDIFFGACLLAGAAAGAYGIYDYVTPTQAERDAHTIEVAIEDDLANRFSTPNEPGTADQLDGVRVYTSAAIPLRADSNVYVICARMEPGEQTNATPNLIGDTESIGATVTMSGEGDDRHIEDIALTRGEFMCGSTNQPLDSVINAPAE